MTNQEINERIASITGFHDKVGLKKRGLWYRPNACGYTSREEEAGRYTIEEAKDHAHPDGEPVTIHKFSTPNYAESLDACSGFERALAGDNRSLYIDTLYIVCGSFGRGLGKDRFETEWTLFTATPLQRREAFLRLKGQWDEN